MILKHEELVLIFHSITSSLQVSDEDSIKRREFYRKYTKRKLLEIAHGEVLCSYHLVANSLYHMYNMGTHKHYNTLIVQSAACVSDMSVHIQTCKV